MDRADHVEAPDEVNLCAAGVNRYAEEVDTAAVAVAP